MGSRLQTVLGRIASAQHGVVAARQLRAVGTRGEVRRELDDSPRWTNILPGIYRSASAPDSELSRVSARLLRAGPGAVVSHRSALVLWGVAQARLEPLHVNRMRGSNGVRLRADGIVPHETRRMPPHHVAVLDGITLTTPARSLADAARDEPAGRIERWLDRAWSDRLLDFEAANRVCADLAKRGRPWISTLWGLVERRGPDYVPPASGLEGRLNQVLARSGLPPAVRQVDVGGSGWLGRVDFRIQGTPVLIEVQSERFHASLSSERDDRERFAALADAGFVPVAVWERDVWQDPDAAIAIIVNAVEQEDLPA